MKTFAWVGLAAAAVALAVSGAASASGSGLQDPVVDPAVVTVAPPAPPPEQWQILAQSATTVYLAEVTAVGEAEGAAILRVARIRRGRPAGDTSFAMRHYAVRCASNEVRIAETVEYGSGGEETERFPGDEPWAEAPANSVDGSVKGFACNELRSTATSYPSVRAYMDAGN